MARSILVLVLLANGCGVGLIGSSRSGGVEVESIGLVGRTAEACTVRIDDAVDDDGVADSQWRAAVELEEGERTRVSYVTAVRARDGETFRKRVSVTLYDAE